MIKKFTYFLISLFLCFSIIIYMLYPTLTKESLRECLNLWLNKVLLALIPSYLISNLLINYPIISKLLYPLLNKIMHFENQKACSLFLLTLITGNPTSSFLIIDSINKGISEDEGIRLLKIAVINSPIFTIMILPNNIGYLTYFIQVLVSIILYSFNKKKRINHKLEINNKNSNLFDIIDNAPSIMLSILSTMLFVNVIRLPIEIILNNLKIKNIFILIILDFLELTTGINNILKYNINMTLKVLLSSFLLSFGGIAIIIQIMNKIKKTSLPKTSLIMSRILHAFLTMIILFIIMLIFHI